MPPITMLSLLLQSGDVEGVSGLLEAHYYPDTRDSHGYTALALAAKVSTM